MLNPVNSLHTIDKNPYTPEKIIEAGLWFRIPLYQRPYTWESQQVMQLMEDLWSSYKAGTNTTPQPYYIGIMNICQTEIHDKKYDLIDGQQRLTTLSVMALVFKEYDKKWGKFCGRLDFYGREEEKQFLEKRSIHPNLKNSNIINAKNEIKKFLTGEKDGEKISFSNYVFSYASFFLSEIPKDYTIIDKNNQFVRMNNRGKQLEQTDILKVKMGKIIGGVDNNFFKDWNRISQMNCGISVENENCKKTTITISGILEEENDNDNNKKEPIEGEIFFESIVSFDEFLLIALDRFLRSNKINSKPKIELPISFDTSKLLKTFGFDGKEKFTEENTWSSNDVNNFMELLNKQYELFVKYFIRKDKYENYKWQHQKTNEEIPQKEIRTSNDWNKLKQFQSYLYVSREPHLWMTDAFDWLSKPEILKNDIEIAFLSELKKKDNENHKLPTDEKELSFGRINRYWFWKLDYYLWENRTELFKDKEQVKIADNYIFRRNRSIEHVAPQNPKQNSDIKWNDEDTALNCFGNLCMISNSHNSSLSNESFEVKRSIVESFIKGEKNGTIDSLKLLKIFEYKKWDKEKSIPEHGKEMYEILSKYSKPQSDENPEKPVAV